MMTRDTLKNFRPNHKYFIGFDSDGCVFDSMELKHKECFIPNIIKYYNLQPVSKYAREVAEFVNLYSYWRGINRFPALTKTFELLSERPEVKKRGVKIQDWTPIQNFIDHAHSLSNPALKEEIKKTGCPVLKHLLEWSEAVNRDIEDMVKGLPPFPFVRESLEKIKNKADTIVISATPTEALNREWEEHNISQFVTIIAGQEFGKKEDQLGLTAKGKYEQGHILMVGDAMSDLYAARSANAMFYPIIPGHEEKSWEIFYNVVIDIFLSGGYNANIEAQFLQEFEKALPKVGPWQQSK